jgi:hypothetical protein
MAISNTVKVGHIDFEPTPSGSGISGSGITQMGFCIQKPEEKQAYITRLARISVGETDAEGSVVYCPITPPQV